MKTISTQGCAFSLLSLLLMLTLPSAMVVYAPTAHATDADAGADASSDGDALDFSQHIFGRTLNTVYFNPKRGYYTTADILSAVSQAKNGNEVVFIGAGSRKTELGLYAFKYLWDDQVHVGVMAQDILARDVFRDAVVLMPNGFYGVNYARLGLKMATFESWREYGLAAVMPRAAASRAGLSLR